MPFTGKATYSAGSTLPEVAEDVSDIVGLLSPIETPLLDLLGDARRTATSTIHEWMEDELLPNSDTLNQTTFTPNPQDATSLTVASSGRFRVGDLVRPGNSREVMFVASASGSSVTVIRRFGNSPQTILANGMKLTIIANAVLEGDDAPEPRFTNRVRKRNYTQIFSATVQVSGTMQAVRQHGVDDEVEYQKTERLRELMRDLEFSVVNGIAPASNQQGASTVRRTFNGILNSISTNVMTPGQGTIPPGDGAGADLNEAVLNASLRQIWDGSGGKIDTIIVPSNQKRRINALLLGLRTAPANEVRYVDKLSVYETDFGTARVVISRAMPADTIALVDSSRVSILPLDGRSFQYNPLGRQGDREAGMVVGEYTLEMRNEAAHGILRGLAI